MAKRKAKRAKASITSCSCSAGSRKDTKLGFPSFQRCRSKKSGKFTNFKGCKRK